MQMMNPHLPPLDNSKQANAADCVANYRKTHGWQPIETAPQGEWVLVADKRQTGDGQRFYTARREDWHFDGMSGVSFEGPYADGYLCDLADIGVEPTHWMPLPSPPGSCDTHPAGGDAKL